MTAGPGGVTKGCNPQDNLPNTEYCPDDFVTREQMAAFMDDWLLVAEAKLT